MQQIRVATVPTGMPDASPISLNAHLDEAFSTLVAHRFNPQNWRVRVGTNHGDGIARL